MSKRVKSARIPGPPRFVNVRRAHGYFPGDVRSLDRPSFTLGTSANAFGGYWLTPQRTEHKPDTQCAKNIPGGKPLYIVPSMDKIAQQKRNGLRMVSTFSGCGGSCLGFEMAGYSVLWASEFIPAAQEVYRLNHPSTILDTRDIRSVTAEDILSATGLIPGELDVLEGSPPCSSFSTAGKREKGWGEVHKYSDSAQRTDDLFFEYIRLLRGLRPRAFVAENVAGLVRGKAKGFFLLVLAAMKDAGYRVSARLLDAQWLGVPQVRKRIIFMGVRNDLATEPVFPSPLQYSYSVRDACPWIDDGWDSTAWPRSMLSATEFPVSSDRSLAWRKHSITEAKLLASFPQDFKLTGTYLQQWERIGRAVPPVMMRHIAANLRDKVLQRGTK